MNYGQDFTQYLVEADLTTDGVQYSTEISTTAIDTDVTAFSYTFDLGFDKLGKFMPRTTRDILWCYFEIHCELKANSSATADIKFKAQARNESGTWVDLFDQVTYADIGTTYVEKTHKGYADLQTNFKQVPFDFRVLFQCDTLNDGRARLKNTSYFRVVFKETE